ncbi:MAG TPA: hypothetical protein VGD80_08430 [Kofleriaceae bacterium]
MGNALTASEADAANYPFCAIAPYAGIVPLPDERFRRIEQHSKTEKVILTGVVIGGLRAGASQGEGARNKYLANVRVVMTVRCREIET